MSEVKFNSNRVFIERHTFHTYRYDVDCDKGFTDNLLGLLNILILDSNTHEQIRYTAKGLLSNVLHHERKIYDEEEVKKFLLKDGEKSVEHNNDFIKEGEKIQKQRQEINNNAKGVENPEK